MQTWALVELHTSKLSYLICLFSGVGGHVVFWVFGDTVVILSTPVCNECTSGFIHYVEHSAYEVVD